MSSDRDRECLACHLQLPDDDKYLTCTACNYMYHLGKCSGVNASSFRSKGDALKAKWRCVTCETASKKSVSTSSEKGSSNMERMLTEINEKLSLLMPLVSKVDALTNLVAKVDCIESSIKHMSEKYDEVLEKVDKQSNDVSALKKKVERLESGNAPVMKTVTAQVNELEQYSRRQNLEIRGFVQEENENLFEKLKDLAVKLGLPELKQSDIENAHRLPEHPRKEPAIIVRFSSLALKEKWAQSRSLLKTLDPKLRFLDNLTAANKRLLWLARTKAEEMNYAFAWQKNGHIFVRKHEGTKPLRIRDEGDLVKMT